MKWTHARPVIAALVMLSTNAWGQEAKKPGAVPDKSFRIEPPVVCRSIEGFEDYERLPNAELTSQEKLLVYFRPRNYVIIPKGDKFAARFTQDGRIRELDKKKVVWRKDDILDYEAVSPQPPRAVYLSNFVSLKGLPPGDYEYDVILRDENGDNTAQTVSVTFRIILPKPPKPQE